MNKILFIAFLLVTSLANAATFSPAPKTIDYELWVTTTGNNANNCTASKPCATLARACTVATRFGTTIRIGAGTFNETATCNQAVGVSIKGAGKTLTTLVAQTSTMTMIAARSATEGVLGNQELSDLTLDGNSLTAYEAVDVVGRSYYKIHDVIIQNFRDDGVVFQGLSTAAVASIEPEIYAVGNEVYNSTITNSSSFLGGFGHGLIWLGGQDQWKIYNNTLTQSGRTAGQNGFCIKFLNNGFLKNGKIFNNTIYHDDATSFDFAIELWNILGNVDIYNNRITGGVDLNILSRTGIGAKYSVNIYNNLIGPTSYSTTSVGVILENSIDGVIISNNVIQNVKDAVSGYDNTFPTIMNDVLIQNNFFKNVKIGFNMYGSNATTTWSNWLFLNNTMIGAAGGLGQAGIVMPIAGNGYNWQIRNNIIINFIIQAAVFEYIGTSGLQVDSVSVENNVFFGNGNSNTPWWNGFTPTNLLSQNNIIADPLLVSLSDAHLQAGSPARNAAIDVGVLFDINNFRRSDSRDIGAYRWNTLP